MSKTKRPDPTEIMVVNDSPGEECRIAILEDGHLEELYNERAATATSVGNIYKGRVTRVEPAIQAAFVDYGEPVSGFLHISDLHPRYFPGGDRTERVGKRTARRDRPLIQEALRSGQEILVQVLKEGIGTKGPTLTSYLSIPGRLIVMMPDMDRVGVSRKVEDEEKRREMRQILDQLDLPDGFGFILRTAGFDKTKTELKRDVAYLLRLWKVMEARMKGMNAPCELYTESDLLIRTIRDVLRPSISAIVVDSRSAYERALAFLRVVTPRSAPKIVRFRDSAPIFHAYDIERQIDRIHSREVPLPSGGALVIEQTEALVAIDVNSGRSRSARDSETNAFRTNCEAVDEIARQLRLRDLGGLIINDLIDMRFSRHRTEIEERFQAHLERDRARWTTAPISEFGVLEMTRQRMRPSLRKSHYMPCPHCEGRGEIKMPDSVAADALRQMGFLMQFDRVKRVELVCSPRVASVLLSRKRRPLVKLELATGKTIDVRVSESVAIDRTDFYAYDDRGADIDVARLPSLKPPVLEELLEAESAAGEAPALEHDDVDVEELEEEASGERTGGAIGPADVMHLALKGDLATALDADEQSEAPTPVVGALPGRLDQQGEEGGRRRRRRRRRRGRRDQVQPMDGQAAASSPTRSDSEMSHAASSDGIADDAAIRGAGESSGDLQAAAGSDAESAGGRRRRRRRRGRRGRGGGGGPGAPQPTVADATMPDRVRAEPPFVSDHGPPRSILVPVDNATEEGDSASDATPADRGTAPDHAGQPDSARRKRRSRRRRRGRRGGGGNGGDGEGISAAPDQGPAPAPIETSPSAGSTSGPSAPQPRRLLYRNRTRIAPTARLGGDTGGDDE